MKRLLVSDLVILFILSSCVSSYYYQIVETRPSSGIKIGDEYMVYENEKIHIIYNFWKRYGEAGFIVHNKSSENIYIHLEECFFVRNGIAYDYYKNMGQVNTNTCLEFYQLSSIGLENSIEATKIQDPHNLGIAIYEYNKYMDANIRICPEKKLKQNISDYSVPFTKNKSNSCYNTERECTEKERIICVPSNSSKYISEYNICKDVIGSCDFHLDPRKNDNHSFNFTKDSTPVSFENIIAYTIGDNKDINRVINKFYVTSISNYSEEECTEKRNVRNCEKQKTRKLRKSFKVHRANMFYIPYQL